MPVRKFAAVRRFFAAVATAACLLLALASVAAAAPVVDGHFPTSETGTNKKIVAGPDGNMWLTINGGGNDVAKIAPDGTITEFELTGVAAPTGIAVDAEGKIWVTQGGGVASFLPSDPKGTSKATAIADVKDPASIVYGPDGNMWVATEGKVVVFVASDPTINKTIPVAGLAPKDIDVSGSELVIADANNKRLVMMTIAGTTQDISLLGSTSTSQGVAAGPAGQIAFAKSDGSEGLGLVTPPAAATAVEMPGDPFGVALGSDGAYWFAMSAAHNVQRLTPDGKATPLNGFPDGEEFFPRQIAAGPNNTLWVTMEKPGKMVWEVARITGLEAPKPKEETKPPAPETKISKGPKKKVTTKGKKAAVTFRFSSTTAAATFECALVKKPAKKGKKAPKPKFKPCTSPRKLKLKPGKYTFSVRATLAGTPDASPATSSFRVVHVK